MTDDPQDDESNAETALRVFAGAAASVGRSVAGAFTSIDPDLRRHAYQLPLLGLMLLAPRSAAVEALPDDGYRPVIFVHGLGGRPQNFLGLKTYFARCGRRRSYVVDFGNARSLEVMAEHLREVIDEVRAVNGLDDEDAVDLVAHSMGGLVSRMVLDDPDYRSRVANLVTLGTPHSGSHLARLASTETTVELRPGSATLRMLEEQEFWGAEGGPLLTAFWSEADTVVLPAESARFDAGRSIEVPGCTHYGYLIDPGAWRAAWNALLR